MIKDLISCKYNHKDRVYDITINSFMIQNIILNKLPLGTDFTLNEITKSWSKNVFKLGYHLPERKYIQKALDELVGTTLTKSYVSLKLLHGSITESKYTRL